MIFSKSLCKKDEITEITHVQKSEIALADWLKNNELSVSTNQSVWSDFESTRVTCPRATYNNFLRALIIWHLFWEFFFDQNIFDGHIITRKSNGFLVQFEKISLVQFKIKIL